MGVEPMEERVRSSKLHGWATHFGQTNPTCKSATGAATEASAHDPCRLAPCYFLLFTGADCVAHAGGAETASVALHSARGYPFWRNEPTLPRRNRSNAAGASRRHTRCVTSSEN